MQLPTFTLFLAAFSLPTAAYVGPGAGLTAIGTVIAVVAALFLAIAGFVWYPVRRMMRKRKNSRADPARPEGEGSSSQE